MKDTYIVFELVLVGFQVLIWLLLLVLSVFGYHWIDINFVKDWATQLSFAALGVAYMLGVIFDKAIASLPFSWVIGGGALTKMRDLPSPLEMRMQILARKAEVNAKAKSGDTPLHLAKAYGQKHITELLLQHGCHE